MRRLFLLRGAQLVPASEHDPVLREWGQEHVVVARLVCQHSQHRRANHLEAVACVTLARDWVSFGFDPCGPAQQPDALHEELVQVGRDDRQELQALEQGRALILGFVQNAPVELEPAQIAIDPGMRQQAFARHEFAVLLGWGSVRGAARCLRVFAGAGRLVRLGQHSDPLGVRCGARRSNAAQGHDVRQAGGRSRRGFWSGTKSPQACARQR